jgi:hypothetical protein
MGLHLIFVVVFHYYLLEFPHRRSNLSLHLQFHVLQNTKLVIQSTMPSLVRSPFLQT